MKRVQCSGRQTSMEYGRQASEVYVNSFSGAGWQARGYAGCWTGQLSWMVPNVAHKVLMRRMMMG